MINKKINEIYEADCPLRLKRKYASFYPSPFINRSNINRYISHKRKIINYQIDIDSFNFDNAIITKDIFKYLYIFDNSCTKLLFYIIQQLEKNCNAVVIDANKINTLFNIDIKDIQDSINELCFDKRTPILSKTNYNDIYIVNHNFIYRGNVDVFLNVYNFKYGLNNKYPINKIDISKELDFINAHIDD